MSSNRIVYISILIFSLFIISCKIESSKNEEKKKKDSLQEIADIYKKNYPSQVLSSVDAEYVADMGYFINLILRAGDALRTKSENKKVVDFSNELQTEYQTLLDKINELGDKKIVAIPEYLKESDGYDVLDIERSRDHEELYLDLIQKEHERLIKLSEKENMNVTDNDIKALIEQMIPQFTSNLDKIKQLKKEI